MVNDDYLVFDLFERKYAIFLIDFHWSLGA